MKPIETALKQLELAKRQIANIDIYGDPGKLNKESGAQGNSSGGTLCCIREAVAEAYRLLISVPPAVAPQEMLLVEAMRADLDTLKALIAQSKMDCIYCGVAAGGPCPAGYPGCGRMDDLMNDADFIKRLSEDMEKHQVKT